MQWPRRSLWRKGGEANVAPPRPPAASRGVATSYAAADCAPNALDPLRPAAQRQSRLAAACRRAAGGGRRFVVAHGTVQKCSIPANTQLRQDSRCSRAHAVGPSRLSRTNAITTVQQSSAPPRTSCSTCTTSRSTTLIGATPSLDHPQSACAQNQTPSGYWPAVPVPKFACTPETSHARHTYAPITRSHSIMRTSAEIRIKWRRLTCTGHARQSSSLARPRAHLPSRCVGVPAWPVRSGLQLRESRLHAGSNAAAVLRSSRPARFAVRCLRRPHVLQHCGRKARRAGLLGALARGALDVRDSCVARAPAHATGVCSPRKQPAAVATLMHCAPCKHNAITLSLTCSGTLMSAATL